METTTNDKTILDTIAKDVAGKTFDEYGGYMGLRGNMKNLGLGMNLSEALNYVLWKSRQISIAA